VSEREPRDVRIEQLERENAALREENAALRNELKELRRIIEQLQERARRGKRQAHPFGRDGEKKDKNRAGRKPGHEGAYRPHRRSSTSRWKRGSTAVPAAASRSSTSRS
jgi:hypothetical protein